MVAPRVDEIEISSLRQLSVAKTVLCTLVTFELECQRRTESKEE